MPLSVLSFSLNRTIENKIMAFWFLISVICFIVGLLRLNPILYLFTDFFYIIIGYFLFRLIQIKDKKIQIYYQLSTRQEFFFIGIIIFLTIIATIFKIIAPSFLIIFTMCYSLYLFKEKNYKIAFFYLIPFFLQILSANRALILVFMVLIFFAFTSEKISKRNITIFFVSSIVIFIALFIFWRTY